jgi:glycogen operon protein
MGEEFSRTQGGNNNAYAQDNETSRLDWEADASDPAFADFIRALVQLRRASPAFARRTFLNGAVLPETGLKDVYWLAPEGREMTPQDWQEEMRRTIGMQLGNEGAPEHRLLLLINAAPESVVFRLSPDFPGASWLRIFDSCEPAGRVHTSVSSLDAGGTFHLSSRSLSLFRLAPIPEFPHARPTDALRSRTRG